MKQAEDSNTPQTVTEPSCDNCKHLDNCPAEYQAENGPYCENYEGSAANG